MVALQVRPIREAEFDAYRRRRVSEYAAAQVEAGTWQPEEAQELAAQASERLLPDGVKTEAALLLAAEQTDGTVIGFAWVALEHQATGRAWLNSVEILPEHRGRGFGRALLAAVERELRASGIKQLDLSVLGSNPVGRRLYDTSGYTTVALHMRKTLD